VHDIAKSSQFYTEVLGFHEVFAGDGWRFVRRDHCTIMLGECLDATPAGDLGDHSYYAYLLVDDVDGFWKEVRKRGVDVTAKLANRPWGMREFGIRTPDGHRVMIGQEIESGSTD
jgi:uncharacterized glyoxalase superfamily protein PhnB